MDSATPGQNPTATPCKITRAYACLTRVLNALQAPLLLGLRLYFGYTLALAGLGKFRNFDQTVGFFTSLGLPMPSLQVVMASSAELFGGALLLLGLASRLISIPVAFTMIVAFLTADLGVLKPDVGFSKGLHDFFAAPGDYAHAAPLPYLYVAILVMLFGPGLFSLDAVICKIKTGSFRCNPAGGAHKV
ncbi:MAG: DoxX family protein [Planctomycetes bacterium]|nr:DoxX family protein [Planctomycetota bacterium]